MTDQLCSCCSLLLVSAQEYVGYLTSPQAGHGSILDYLLHFHMQAHPYRGLRFTRHCRKQQAITTMAKSLLAVEPARTLVGWGDRGRAGAGLIRRQCGPSDKVAQVLQRMCTLVYIDEYRTSKVGQPSYCLCSKMHSSWSSWKCVTPCGNLEAVDSNCNQHQHADPHGGMVASLVCIMQRCSLTRATCPSLHPACAFTTNVACRFAPSAAAC